MNILISLTPYTHQRMSKCVNFFGGLVILNKIRCSDMPPNLLTILMNTYEHSMQIWSDTYLTKPPIEILIKNRFCIPH